MRNLIYIGGVYHLAFAVFHLFFPRLFDWNNDLRRLKPVNRSIMQILNLRLIYVFIIVAIISFFFAERLTEDLLGRSILVSVAGFWLFRAVEQIVFFGIRSHISNLMLLIFIAGAVIYGCPAFFIDE